MRFRIHFVVSALLGAASAVPEASVYIFTGQDSPSTSNPPVLSPQQARLILAQRLGVSEYHDLKGLNDKTLSYINTFGGRHDPLFQDLAESKPAELVIILDGLSSGNAGSLMSAWSSIEPAFKISGPPSSASNQKLVLDLNKQAGESSPDCPFEDAVNPFNERCWNGRAKAMHMDLSKRTKNAIGVEDFIAAQEQWVRLAKKTEMNVLVAVMPESSQLRKGLLNSYGLYQMPSKVQLGQRQSPEEPMTDPSMESPSSPISNSDEAQAPNSSYPPLRGVIPFCHSSYDSCTAATNNCSGHGTCFRKYGSDGNDGSAPSACYTCGCVSTVEYVGDDQLIKTTVWAGAACSKKDVSGAFWLLAGFSIVLIIVLSWAIGLLFNVGEEKLPGVIGAGVSSKSR